MLDCRFGIENLIKSEIVVAEWDLNPHFQEFGAAFGLCCKLVAITLNSLAFAGKERIKEDLYSGWLLYHLSYPLL